MREKYRPPQIVMTPIRSLKLAPGDTLILHFAKQPTDSEMAALNRQLIAESWGLADIKVKVLYGPFNIMSVKEPT